MDDNAGLIGIITEAIKRWMQERQSEASGKLDIKNWAKKEDGLDENGDIKEDWLVAKSDSLEQLISDDEANDVDKIMYRKIRTMLSVGEYFSRKPKVNEKTMPY